MPDGQIASRFGAIALSGDDRTLPEEERAMLERARALIPLLAERAPAATAARKLPAETIAEYREAGIMRILQPRRFGGMQGRFSLFSRIVEELTYGCASSAWVYAVLRSEYREAGIMRILQPRRFGGMQGRFSLFSRIVEELTYGCASSAWVYAVLAEHQWISAQYPEQAQIDVWGK